MLKNTAESDTGWIDAEEYDGIERRDCMKKNLKTVLGAVIVIALIVGCYYYMSHRKTTAAEDDVEITQLQEVLSKKLDSSYPPTPREVIKFYNRILECAYGGEYDEAQFDRLINQARKLMDEELLENNPQDTYKSQFQQEISSYKEKSQKILQTTVCDSDEVDYREVEGRKCAYVDAAYFMKAGKGDFYKTSQSYLLRKDQNGCWKILAYKLISSNDDEE